MGNGHDLFEAETACMHEWYQSRSVKKERKLCATTPESKLPPSSVSDISDSTDSFVFVLFAWRFCLHQVLTPTNPTSVSNMEKSIKLKVPLSFTAVYCLNQWQPWLLRICSICSARGILSTSCHVYCCHNSGLIFDWMKKDNAGFRFSIVNI